MEQIQEHRWHHSLLSLSHEENQINDGISPSFWHQSLFFTYTSPLPPRSPPSIIIIVLFSLQHHRHHNCIVFQSLNAILYLCQSSSPSTIQVFCSLSLLYFPSTNTTTTFLLFSVHHRHIFCCSPSISKPYRHISIVLPPPPPSSHHLSTRFLYLIW